MRNILITVLIPMLLFFNVSHTNTQTKWSVETLVGDAYCFKTPLTIKQTGYDDINFQAKYSTNSFKLPIYYSVHIAKWNREKAWELEFVHLKIKLNNNPPEVQRFEISHGFNLLIVNRIWENNKFIFRFGGGIVIAHPENIVRGKPLNQNKGILNKGYYIAGPTAQLAIGKRFSLFNNLVFMLAGKLTGAYARVPVKDGHANVTNVAVHCLVGLSYEFK